MHRSERHLVIGGARSGKSRIAQALAEAAASTRGAPVVYVATAQAGDEEMSARIARHRRERPSSWRTIEAPRHPAKVLAEVPADGVVLIDCLTLWLSNALLDEFQESSPLAELPQWTRERAALLRALTEFPGAVLIVSNEVGSGIVPAAPLARRFQDEQGLLNQAVAALCNRVTLAVAGIPVAIKAP